MNSAKGFREDRTTAFENCLKPLLKALHWRGNVRSLKEAMPHFTKLTTSVGFCDVLFHLNYEHSILHKPKRFDPRLLPFLLVTDDNQVMVALKLKDNVIKVFNGLTSKEQLIPLEEFFELVQNARIFIFRKKEDDESEQESRGWFWKTFRKNKGLVYSAIFLSLILNLLILTVPLFVMTVYDKVIGTSSYSMLNQLSAGIAIALIGMYIIYRIRAKHLSLIGARCDKTIGDQIVNQLLYLAPSFTETVTTGAQVARIKDFDRVREFFSGPFIAVFFELPFIFIAIILIALVAGPLVYIPLSMIFLYFLLGFIISYKIQDNIKLSAKTFSKLQEFLLEAIENFRVLKYTASIEKWSDRYRDFSASAGLSGVKISLFDSIISGISEVIMIGSALLVLAFGAVLVMKGQITVGAMLAVMIIIWRILTPLKTIFNSLPRLVQLISSIGQINRLMDLKSETEASIQKSAHRMRFHGDVEFQRVSMRYPNAYSPSLVGVSFSIKAGSCVALVGRNGSGKSTVLKLLLGLYYPQAGGILIDNREIRQLNPLDLRSGVSYLSQYPELFFGTVAANLRLADPTATDMDLRRAAREAGILRDIESLPNGFETQLTDQSTQGMASSFRQCLCLARAYLRNNSILLLDEPGNTLDNEADLQLLKHLEEIKGKKTVILVTHRPSHLSRVDSVILLDQGQMVLQGPPGEVLNKIPLELL